MATRIAAAPVFWNAKRIRFFCRIVLAGLVSHIFWIYLTDTNSTSLLKRGDFPSFYAAGMIVRQHLTAQLYDTKLLTYVQNLYWPSLRGNYISFPYPPFVALGLSIFAFLPPLVSKIIFNFLMGAALVVSLNWARPRSACLRTGALGLAAFFLGFFPVSFGVLGSQFTALNMLLYAGTLAGLSRNTLKGDWMAGVSLGLWFFKPQYALFFLFFLMLAGIWRVVLICLAVLAVYGLTGVMMTGFDWPWTWLSAATAAAKIDFAYNHFNMISLSGFFYSLSRIFGASPFAEKMAGVIPGLLSALLAAGLSFLFLKSGKIMGSFQKRERLLLLLGLAAPVVLLCSSHALFYDLGILVIACAPYLNFNSDKKNTGLILLTALASVFTAFKGWLPFQPLTFYVFGALWFLWKQYKIAIQGEK